MAGERGAVAIVGMWQETNTYSSRATTLADFEAFELLEGDSILARHRGTGSVIGGFLDGLGEGVRPVPVFSAGAWPAAPPGAATAVELLRRLESALQAAPDVDGVLVNLHGAMVAEGADDMEAEALRRIRARYPQLPLIVVLDLHANFSAEACGHCDAAIGYRTYPHVDMRDCGEEAAALMRRAVSGERFACAYGKLGVLTSPLQQGTADQPMRGLIERAEARAAEAGVERVSLLPGFPYCDVPRAGFGVIAVATAAARSSALGVVTATLGDVRAEFAALRADLPDAADAVRQAVQSPARPVILADIADNIGGGGPGDGTALLAELIRQRAAGSVVAIADAAAVAAAWDAGVDGSVDIEIGGKTDALHGPPVPLSARVVRLGDGDYRVEGSYMTGQRFSLGRTAVLETPAGVTVLATERATPPFHIEQLTTNGIDPAGASIIVVKGAVAWRAAYGQIIGSAIAVDTPGCCPADPHRLERRFAAADVAPCVPSES